MSDTVLVTGARGFVGTHLVAALREQGCRVVTHSRLDGDIQNLLNAARITGHGIRPQLE